MTELFEKLFPKIIPKQSQEDMRRRIQQLSMNPYVGKTSGNRYLRELKIDKFRVYYYIFDNEVIIYLMAVSDKKHQKETINLIKRSLPELEKLVKNININR